MKKFACMVLAVAFVINSEAQSSDPKVMNNFIDGLMKKMTLQEKLGQLNLITPGSGIPTGAVVSTDVEKKLREGKVGGMFGVIGYDKIKKAQDIVMNESRLKIPLFFGSDVIHGYKTTFPIPLALSCSWDTALIRRSAMIAADEASADGLNWTFSPMVDIARDPRWGRVAEGAGEDPFLGAQIAAAMVKGYQGASLAANNTLMACVKHFALYGAAEAGRDYNSVDMSRNKMYNEYLPPYKAAVDAGVASVMSSFNDIDGVPATGNRWLLTDLLRKQWNFNGFVVSDYTSLSEMINHGMGNLQEVSALALNAGLDMDMVAEGLLNTLALSLAEKKVSLSQIDAACRNILVAKYKLGLFDHPYKTIDEARAKATILSTENRAFARTVAAQSFVLLKNEQQALPLSNKETLALIGPLANDKSNMLGTWAVGGDPQLSVPVFTGMKEVGGAGLKIVYAKGANITDDPALAARANVFGMRAEIDARSPEVMLEEAMQIAKTADKIVAVVGEASEMSGEAASRADISLPASQQKLLKALYATGKPVIVVNMSGRPLVLTGLTEGAAAIIQVWHAGIEAGNAIADVLFGKVNPSGKLTMSFPVAVGQIPVYYSQKNTGRPQSAENKFSSKYLDIPNEPLFPFGYGLNYSKIAYSKPEISNTTLTSKKPITVTVKVTNSGKYDAQEVVQCYTQDKVRSITPPGKELKAFQKISLKAGETKQVVFTITESMLAFWNANLKYAAEPGEFNVMVGGNSRDVQSLSFQLK
ncbi:MAG: beta-glucosidase BglX [Chitinophagia bacterium]|nr:beta-glucosidase BglX [Chitinophagia bacterium]